MMKNEDKTPLSAEGRSGYTVGAKEDVYWAVFNFTLLVYPTVSRTRTDTIERAKTSYGEDAWAEDGETEMLSIGEFSLDQLGVADSIGIKPYLKKLKSVGR